MLLEQLLEKYKEIINKINNTTNYDFENNRSNNYIGTELIPISDIILLIEKDIINPKNIKNRNNDNFFATNYFFYETGLPKKLSFLYSNEEKQQELLKLTELLIVKGVDINNINNFKKSSILNTNNEAFLSKNIKLLIEKYNLNIFNNNSDEWQKTISYYLKHNILNFEEIFPIYIEKINSIDNLEDISLIFRISEIKNDKIRYNCFKKAIELKIDLNLSEKINMHEHTNIYKSIKTFDEFILIKNSGYTLNENDFIFNFLNQDFEKNIKLIENNYNSTHKINDNIKEQSFINKLNKNNQILDSNGNSYLAFIMLPLKKLITTFDRTIFEEFFNNFENLKNNTPIHLKRGDDETELNIIELYQIYTKINILKNKYGFNLKEYSSLLDNYIKNEYNLKFFIELGFDIDFEQNLPIHHFNYKKIVELNIPKLICGDKEHNFGKIFYKNVLKSFFPKIHNDNFYFKLYLQKYKVKIDSSIIEKVISKIKGKEQFQLIINTHPKEIKQLFDKIMYDNKCLCYISAIFLKNGLNYIENNYSEEEINNFIYNHCFSSIRNIKVIKTFYSIFGEEKFKKILEKFDLNDIDRVPVKQYDYFEFFAKRGIVKNLLNYFEDVIKIEEFNESCGKKILSKIIDKYPRNMIDTYLGSQCGYVINEIENNPQKVIYCNKYVFEAVDNEILHLAIKELKNKYENYNVNDKDDYGFTITDYYFFNMMARCLSHDMGYVYFKVSKLLCHKKETKIFINNCLELFKNEYDFSFSILNSFSKLDKTIYQSLETYIEKLQIKQSLDFIKDENKKNMKSVLHNHSI